MSFAASLRRVGAVTNRIDAPPQTNRQASQLVHRGGRSTSHLPGPAGCNPRTTLAESWRIGRGKLHSRTPEHAHAELEWSLLGLCLIQLLAAAEQIPQGIGPERTSVSLAVQVFQDAISRGHTIRLKSALGEARKDTYQRRKSKAARYQPKNKDKPKAGKPIVVNANAEQRRNYRILKELEISLTA